MQKCFMTFKYTDKKKQLQKGVLLYCNQISQALGLKTYKIQFEISLNLVKEVFLHLKIM